MVKADTIARERAMGVQRKPLNFRHETWLPKPIRKSLIFPVIIPSVMFYHELGGKFGSERYMYIRHHTRFVDNM